MGNLGRLLGCIEIDGWQFILSAENYFERQPKRETQAPDKPNLVRRMISGLHKTNTQKMI